MYFVLFVQTYTSEKAAEIVHNVQKEAEILDPLGGLASSSSSTTNIIPICTDDLVCDLEELCIEIRSVLKVITIKVKYHYYYLLFVLYDVLSTYIIDLFISML